MFHHRLLYELDLVCPSKDGQQPYWQGTLYRAHLKPTARAVGISGKIGWHTLQHIFATLFKANGEDTKTVPELLQHTNVSVTMNAYAQGVIELKRHAQSRIVRMVNGGKSEEWNVLIDFDARQLWGGIR